jgi:hydroxymethylpyrimidine/phosphomethylpyrimidine kinase
MKGRVLVVAGSDSSGGAGIQADVKTITALGGYAATAVTALTAQNTTGVFGTVPVPPAFVALQMQAVLDDIGADAVKTGMLHDLEVVEAVAQVLTPHARRVPLVVDPVLLSGHGAPLLSDAGRRHLATRLLPMATLVTPNAPEAEVLTGVEVRGLEGMQHAADRLLLMGAEAVLVKGGHLEGPVVLDLLRTADGVERIFEGPRLASRSTHGTGCTLASAIALALAEGHTLEAAVQHARDYVREAIAHAPGYGRGNGPLHHAFAVEDGE